MGKNERKSYLLAIKKRYKKACKGDKKLILNEFCEVCGFNRKYAIRLLNTKKQIIKKRLKPGPKVVYYEPELLNALKTIWLVTDQMCSKRLVAALPLWLPFYEKNHTKLSEQSIKKLNEISASTIDRLLKPTRIKYSSKGMTGTKPGRLLRNQIPIRTDTWDISEPGFMEADTVAHCGNSLAGSFVWSLTLTDYYSGWTECRATWNKGAVGVVDKIKDIEKNIPFVLKGFDCDNGSEFLNYHLLRYFQEHTNVIQFTRSRPYKKNDNAHVEQKNWTHVRQLFGYDRLDNIDLIDKMNSLYANEWSLLGNYFGPTLKLIEKTRINSKYKRKYDKPKTPYQRLIESDAISDEIKLTLNSRYQKLDPFKLKASVERKLKAIFKLVTVTQNVRLRL